MARYVLAVTTHKINVAGHHLYENRLAWMLKPACDRDDTGVLRPYLHLLLKVEVQPFVVLDIFTLCLVAIAGQG